MMTLKLYAFYSSVFYFILSLLFACNCASLTRTQMVAEFTFNVMRGNESRGWCVICVDVVLALSGGGGMFDGRERR